jgi:hypothetical protein
VAPVVLVLVAALVAHAQVALVALVQVLVLVLVALAAQVALAVLAVLVLVAVLVAAALAAAVLAAAVLVVRAMVNVVHHVRSRVHVVVENLKNCSRNSRSTPTAMPLFQRAPSWWNVDLLHKNLRPS